MKSSSGKCQLKCMNTLPKHQSKKFQKHSKPCFLLCIKTHKGSIDSTPERTHPNFLFLLLTLVAKWCLLCQLRSCWQLKSQHACHGMPSGLQNVVNSITRTWHLSFHYRSGWWKFSKREESERAFPNHVKSSHTAALNCGTQPERIQLLSWLIHFCLLLNTV